jgi:hypothetical protein
MMYHMIFLLSSTMFTLLKADWLTKNYFTAFSEFADKKNLFSLSLVLIVFINSVCLPNLQHISIQNRRSYSTLTTAFLCCGVYCLLGRIYSPRAVLSMSPDLIAVAVNNVLVSVYVNSFWLKLQCLLHSNIPYYIRSVAIKKFLIVN